ncbi:hypothetical protein TNCV_1162661 [Trichonephila clavipes]|nr:hypothetical protein TNCV_1162661 [Trichonephila clavipes]
MLSRVYGDFTMVRSKAYEWHRRFKEGQKFIEDNERVGRPSTSQNAGNVALMSEYVRKDHRQILSQFAEAAYFSEMLFEGIHLS